MISSASALAWAQANIKNTAVMEQDLRTHLSN
jgi:hypothetical protein